MNNSVEAPGRRVLPSPPGDPGPRWEQDLTPPAGQDSPVQDPDLLAAGQGRSELVRFVDQRGFLELLPSEVPLLLAALGDGVAVDSGPQVGVDPGTGSGVSGVVQLQRGWDQGLMGTGLRA